MFQPNFKQFHKFQGAQIPIFPFNLVATATKLILPPDIWPLLKLRFHELRSTFSPVGLTILACFCWCVVVICTSTFSLATCVTGKTSFAAEPVVALVAPLRAD
jgi:hypothetical protein